jgi:hypothetical protein
MITSNLGWCPASKALRLTLVIMVVPTLCEEGIEMQAFSSD